MKVLAIETSCDETAVALAEARGAGVRIVADALASQIDIHSQYGGVVPEVAAREHVGIILPLVHEVLKKGGIDPEPLRTGKSGVDAIAVTRGPGLMTSLQTGVETAKSLAYAWNLPLVGVNHIEGHICANFIDREKSLEFPVIVLTVSGGHNLLAIMRGHGDLELIGETRDDAAGEAFDKAAKLLGLGYPGGPAVSACAEQLRIKNEPHFAEAPRGTELKIVLPRPMIDSKDYDFSFSGLKTALRYAIEADADWRERVDEYSYEFQEAVVEVLVTKTIRAAREYGARTVMLSGGVAANKRLREALEAAVREKLDGVEFLMPALKYTTDNAAMVASAGVFRALRKDFIDWRELVADCNYKLV